MSTPPSRVELPYDWQVALEHLAERDARLGALIAAVGSRRLELRPFSGTFETLVRSIVYQQLTGKAAATIHGRVCALFDSGRPHAGALLELDDDALRGAGLSRSKILALRDLATRTLAGTLPDLPDLHTMTDDAIIERLVEVRGIGRWSAEMLLIFGLGRPDVLPVGDFGVRAGFKLTYRKREMPSPKALAAHGARWKPYRSVASWLMWRAVELAR